jgi:stearoyl-CoA desaturase (delta-9 desaturase)
MSKDSKGYLRGEGEAVPPAGTRIRTNHLVVAYLCLIHLIAVSAFFLPLRPGYLWLAIFNYFFIGFSTTIGLHRLLSHRSFRCPKWVEYTLVTGAMLTGQGSPLLWVANHRLHHQHSDKAGDVHSPRRGFWYSHLLWIVDDNSTDPDAYRKYCKDLTADRYYHWLVRYRLAPQLAAVLLCGITLGWAAVPCVFILPVVCWMHSTYSVNSFCHHDWFGSRMFETRENSRNVWWVGLIALGEGWHNNHHAFPRSVKHGMRWNQIDLSYWVIRLSTVIGLAWDLKQPQTVMSRQTKLQPASPRRVRRAVGAPEEVAEPSA